MLHAFIPLKPFTFFGNKCVKRVTAREDICMFSYFWFMLPLGLESPALFTGAECACGILPASA